MTGPLVDTHCHVDTAAFDADRREVLARARAAGVVHLVLIGSAVDPGGEPSAVALARSEPSWMRPTIGVHPHDAWRADLDVLDRTRHLAGDPFIVAVGEVGLDHHYDHSPRAKQEEVFRAQIGIAREVRKPLVIHSREAAADTLRVLEEEGARDVGGVLHCFSEDAAHARRALDLGFIASFSGVVTFRSAAAVQEAARLQPLDALLVETDAPYLAPVPLRGKRNEPAHVAHVADFLADLRGLDRAALREATTANARRVFGLA